jgi:very-short-patch-repair endonuclease
MSERQQNTHRNGFITTPHMLLLKRLNKERIPYLAEFSFKREGEFTDTGAQKFWVVDVFLPPKLIIEINGKVHWRSRSQMRRDQRKANWLVMNGYVQLVFENPEVKYSMDSVIDVIKDTLMRI